MPESPIEKLREQVIRHSLFEPTTLQTAIRRLEFVQADPIRSPARAQDLILRHRVSKYRAGDLERLYHSLGIEEDFLYAYGFLPRETWRLLHPRRKKNLTKIEKRVLEVVTHHGRMHPRELESHLGAQRVVNPWGGYSKATTRALEILHYRGLLRIAGRDNGIRIYEPLSAAAEPESRSERLRKLILVVASTLAPIPRKTLQTLITRYSRLGNTRQAVTNLLRTGELEEQTIEGLTYVWPARKSKPKDLPRTVRFLAPFDPIVWDRRRFEHLWNWAYRFEAYTPPAKRIRGYYAMPLLWGTQVIGWANAKIAEQQLSLELGFIGKRPTDRAFANELEAETERMIHFLRLKSR